MERLSKEQRHKCMVANKSKNTRPEMLVRRFLWKRGFRYRVNVKRLPGTPDIVLRRYKTVIFVNGCFWHGHEECDYFRTPKTNTEFWQKKIARNKERDLMTREKLKRMGWRTMVVWECQLKKDKLQNTLLEIEHILCECLLKDVSMETYLRAKEKDPNLLAAEESTSYK